MTFPSAIKGEMRLVDFVALKKGKGGLRVGYKPKNSKGGIRKQDNLGLKEVSEQLMEASTMQNESRKNVMMENEEKSKLQVILKEKAPLADCSRSSTKKRAQITDIRHNLMIHHQQQKWILVWK